MLYCKKSRKYLTLRIIKTFMSGIYEQINMRKLPIRMEQETLKLDTKQHVGRCQFGWWPSTFCMETDIAGRIDSFFGRLGGNVITIGRYVLQSSRKFPNCNKPENGNSFTYQPEGGEG